MTKYIIQRLLRSIPVIFFVSVLVVFMVELLPGDPALYMFTGQELSADTIAKARETLGLDQPAHIRYIKWLLNVLRGDLGKSIYSGHSVSALIKSAFPLTIELALAAMSVTVIIGVSLGTLAAIKQNTWIDSVIVFISTIGVSMPLFWMGLMFILLFSVKLGWFPVAGIGWKSLVLPSIALGLQSACLVARLTRTSVLQILREEYVVTAKAKGITERMVITRHVLRNAFIPVFTVLGVQMGWLMGGAVIIETVFARSGLGRLCVTGIKQMDFPVIQGVVLLVSVIYVLINLLVDIVNAYLDPRISYS